MKEFLSHSEEETKNIAIEFATNLIANKEKATVVGLYGDLGAGKTTFMKYLAEYFGVKETVQSPTFVIEKIYSINIPDSLFTHLIHIDAYRIEKAEEMVALGWNEIIKDPKNLICVEWPERLEGIMPPHFVIRFEHVSKSEGQTERKISFA